MRKNRFSKTIALALSGVVLFSALQCGFVAVAEENGPEDEATENIEQLPEALSSMDAVQENASFALYCDQTNGNFAVLDKRSGAVWYAFDPDYANAVTVEGTAEEAGSLLKIAFYDKDSMLDVMTSAVDAVGRHGRLERRAAALEARLVHDGDEFLRRGGEFAVGDAKGVVCTYNPSCRHEEVWKLLVVLKTPLQPPQILGYVTTRKPCEELRATPGIRLCTELPCRAAAK